MISCETPDSATPATTPLPVTIKNWKWHYPVFALTLVQPSGPA